ncbi:hypothetical protein PIB30_016781 [Stylosanthes scabra]|uniref:Uncharacterized protein n=1 Tax=Stylosanthes scabra TaxID=79078 RepID=A0ABU6R7Q4_9FABA|nr:hypothetical protein [Stylosanthes scabra]
MTSLNSISQVMGRAGNTCVCPSLQLASPEMMGGGYSLERSGDMSHTKGNALSFCDCGQAWCRCKSTDHCEHLRLADEVEDFNEDSSNNGDEEDWRVNFSRSMGILLEVKVRTIKMTLRVMFGTLLSIVVCGLGMWLGKN